MICPKCKAENNDNWPVKIGDKILMAGCQKCWEKECDLKWWLGIMALTGYIDS